MVIKKMVPATMKIPAPGNTRSRENISMTPPATRDPVSIPRLWAVVIMDMTAPMAFFLSPFCTDRAVNAGVEIPPPRPKIPIASKRWTKPPAKKRLPTPRAERIPPAYTMEDLLILSAKSPMGTCNTPEMNTPELTRIPILVVDKENF